MPVMKIIYWKTFLQIRETSSFSERVMLNLARLVPRTIAPSFKNAIPAISSSFSLPCVSFSSFEKSRSLPSSSPSSNSPSSLLQVVAATPILVHSCGIKHMGKLQKRCRHCYFAVKDEQKYVMCTANPRWFRTETMTNNVRRPDLNEKCRHYAAQKLVGLKWGNMIMTHATQVNFLISMSVLLKKQFVIVSRS